MIDGNVVPTLAAAALGLSLGFFFYGGLWWTVRLALRSRLPGLWFVCSLALRTVVVLAGIYLIGTYLIGGAPWQRMLVCLLGFLAARPLMARLVRSAVAPPAAAPMPSSANR